FGLRHAFDADHISAVDNVTRRLLHGGRNPLGTGFYFSLGHSSVVFIVAVGLVLFARGAVHGLTLHLARVGGVVGALVSGCCLILVGAINLIVLTGAWGRYRGVLKQPEGDPSLDRLSPSSPASPGGIFSRLFGRLFRLVQNSRRMYPIGFLFGLGFDTASEVALLALSATTAGKGGSILGAVALPILFAAGMGLVDTSDAVVMVKAYSWSSANPRRGMVYNIIVTSLSVGIAFTIGAYELIHVLPPQGTHGTAAWPLLGHMGFWSVGIAITAVFVVTWIAATVLAARRRDELDRPAQGT
ncbi:MAG TPA: HoxN/HupN/NixA family nickel/cobalt transporter, partial [Spirochaetia bacterium]|nr:HoxN/HupN/NixA family nickel/cobalt transporter [Spirochaetia bacterium]